MTHNINSQALIKPGVNKHWPSYLEKRKTVCLFSKCLHSLGCFSVSTPFTPSDMIKRETA